jgi:2-oxoglutarate dehydrogenase E2 component (dihydrolipoamide succinyltransferase)
MNDMTVKANDLDIIAPLEQEGTHAVLRTWLKRDGERVHKHEPIVELETDKVVVELAAPGDGVLEILLGENAEAVPGAVLGHVRGEASSSEPAGGAASSATHFAAELRLSPAVRRLLSEHQLDPARITGTGRGGRITREDVIGYLAEPSQKLPASIRGQPACNPAPETIQAARDPQPASTEAEPALQPWQPRLAEQIPHDSLRRKIAEHLHASVSTAPHVTSVFEADFTAVIAHRQRHQQRFAEQGAHLTFTAYFIAASVQAMAAAPSVNSRWHADFLQLFHDVNIGIATALGEQGLIVPVLQRAQELSLLGIATQLQNLTEAARAGKLKPAQVQGGTFTISNHGTTGSLLATPIIIHQPQSAILGVGAVEKRVVVKELDGSDVFVARPKAYVTLTIDHRVMDGSVANAWLRRFVQVLEAWPLEA